VHWHWLSLSLASGGGESERDDGRIVFSLDSIYGLVVLWVSMERLMGPVPHYLLLRRGRRVVLRMSGTVPLPIRERLHEIPPPTMADERRSSLRQELLLSLCLGRGCGLA
jgi:hypothetical protein